MGFAMSCSGARGLRVALCLVLSLVVLGGECPGMAALPSPAPASDPFLHEVQRRAFLFFWNEADPATGLVKDRADNFRPDEMNVGSIAATGFGLAALPVGVERGWVSRDKARARAIQTLRFFETKAEQHHGLYHHFLEFGTGARAWNSELSTIDTALLVAGAIVAGQYFGGDVLNLAEGMEERVDWVYWSPRRFVSHGSRPERGEFLAYDYGGYSEALLLYILAIGSPSHPTPARMWHDLGRNWERYGPYSSIAGSSLFVNQYQNLFVDLKGVNDGQADYWQVARVNTEANRLFCVNQSDKYAGFGENAWGLTAGDGPDGYRAWAALPGHIVINGTINPHAAGGSVMFAPELCRSALRTMLDTYRPHIWGRYGFSDGFNVGRNWWDPHVVGIDTGATLLSIENHRTGLIQRLFMRHATAKRAMDRIGFKRNPHPLPALPVAGLMQITADRDVTVEFALPARAPSAWGASPTLLYGGIVDGPVTITLNGRMLGRAEPEKGPGSALAFRVPPAALKWGASNTLVLRAQSDAPLTYGPIHIGPRAAHEWKPLAIREME